MSGSDTKISAIHTDGACSGTNGGWAVILSSGEGKLIIYGGEPNTTNNRMEITSFLEALKICLRYNIRPTIHSDSEYVVKSYNSYIESWVRNKWKKADGKPVKNEELWKAVLDIKRAFRDGPKVVHVRGHSGDDGNEAADEYAVKARLKVAETGKAFQEKVRERGDGAPTVNVQSGNVQDASNTAEKGPDKKVAIPSGMIAFRILVERHKAGKMTMEDLYDEVRTNGAEIFG